MQLLYAVLTIEWDQKNRVWRFLVAQASACGVLSLHGRTPAGWSLRYWFCACRVFTLHCWREKTESFASDYRCTRTFQEIRRRTAVPEYFVHGFRRRADWPDWPERLGQIDSARNSVWPRASGYRRSGDSQAHAAQQRRAKFGISAGCDD